MTKALEDIEKLVAQVAAKAVSGEASLDQQVDALKLLTPYYAILKKAKGKSDDEPADDQPTMGDMQRRLRVIEQEPADDGRVETASRRPRKRS